MTDRAVEHAERAGKVSDSAGIIAGEVIAHRDIDQRQGAVVLDCPSGDCGVADDATGGDGQRPIAEDTTASLSSIVAHDNVLQVSATGTALTANAKAAANITAARTGRGIVFDDHVVEFEAAPA